MSEYAIYGETLTATADAIRESLNAAEYIINSGTKSDRREIRWVADDSVQILYREFVDYSDTYSNGIKADGEQGIGEIDKTIIAYSYLYNNDGEIVPVLYWTSLDSNPDPDTAEPLYYIGQEIINEETYDKWRKIDGDSFDWDYDAKYYIYTNPIVNINSEIEGIDPVDFPEHIYTIASAIGIESDDGDNNEAYNNAVRDYAPMIIHGVNGNSALSREYFTNIQIGDVIFNYADVLTFSAKFDNTNALSLAIANNNQVLTCTMLINAVCHYQKGSQLGSETIERTVTVRPMTSKGAVSFVAKQAVGADRISWDYSADTLQWSIA